MELHAASRLAANLVIKMKENYSEKEFNEDVKLVETALESKKPKAFGTKAGLTLFLLKDVQSWHGPKQFLYFATRKGEIVGLMKLTRNYSPVKESNISVHTIFVRADYRGKSLGMVLYLAAIRIFKSITSFYGGQIGIMAVKTWHKLDRYYRVQLYSTAAKGFVKFSWSPEDIPMVETIRGPRSIARSPGMFLFYTSVKLKA